MTTPASGHPSPYDQDLSGSAPDADGDQDTPIEVTLDADVRLGYVTFDGAAEDNAVCGAVVAADRWDDFRRDAYVGIRDQEKGLEFLGRIVAGPFHRHLGDDAVPAAIPGDESNKDYRAFGKIEVLGQLIEGERVVPTPTRPRPRSEVYVFPDHRLRQFLGVDGDFQLGHLVGHARVSVQAQGDDKNFLPRNVGIFGTVGSGKSNTAQVLVEEALDAGWAVVLIDVEGEYVRMNEPTDDDRLLTILKRDYHLPPRGIDDAHVYVPSSGRSEAASPTLFKIPISALYPEVVADILEFSEAEMRVFGMATQHATSRYAPSSVDPEGAASPEAASSSERPYTLQHLIDGLLEGPQVGGRPTVRLLPLAKEHDVATASMLRSKLLHLARSDMLDWNQTAGVPELPIADLLVGGRLSVLDVSETNDRSRNIAIAYVLQALFERVIATPIGEPMPSGEARPPLLVVVEEVHTFVSRAAAPKMKALLDNLQLISRRGRKRWMALALVSQQPDHIPNEIFELANTRFIHQIKSTANLDPVRKTTGSVDESLWAVIPSMGPGQCLVAGSVFNNPLFVNIRPARSRRLLVT